MLFAPWPPRDAVPPPDDAGLARRVAAGDAGGLELAYRRESGAVYRYALAMCGNPAWAADATHEAFAAFAARPLAFDARRGSLGAYLAGVARHALLSQWRRQALPAGISPDPLDETTVAADGNAEELANPETLLVRAESIEAVWAALRSLPWAMREAVVLVDLQERSYQQAALIAGIELNTLRTRLHRARLRLAELLSDGDGGHP